MRTWASASATVASGPQDHRLGRHHAAGGVLDVGHQPPDVLGLLGLHQLEQRLGGLGRQLGDQVGGVVGGHLLEDVGGPLGVEVAEDLDLVLLGQLLEDVGEPLVVERRDDRGAPLGGRSWITLAASAGRSSSSAASRCVAPWVGSSPGQARRPRPTRRRGSGPRRRSALAGSCRATRLSTQSRVRACSIATS